MRPACKAMDSARKPRQRARQHMHAARYPLRRCILIRPMAHPAAARNKQHRHRRNARHEKGIVISAAHHAFVTLARGFCRLLHGIARIAASQRAGGSAFTSSVLTATPRLRGYLLACRLQRSRSRHRAARRPYHECRFPAHPRRNAVHRARKHFAHCPPCHGVDRAGRLGRRLRAPGSTPPPPPDASFRPGISLAPACPPSPSMRIRKLAGAAICVTSPTSIPSCSSSGPCSMCSSTNCWNRPRR